MRVRNLSMGMAGEDVKLLHDELERLGYRIPQDEKKKKYFGDKTHNTVIRFKKKHKLSPTGIVDAQTAKLINKAVKALKPQHKLFMVKGAVRLKVRTPFPDAVVKAFDKDMRQEQLLGVANTDQKGHYEITYSRDRFRRAEKKSADLIVRVYDPKAADLILGESKLIFNAQPVEVVNLAVTQTFSEYEQYMATIGPVRENIPVSELSKEDIVFISSEIGIEIQRIEFLVTAARLSKQTELPPEVFYGLFRQGKPTILSDLLERDSTDLRDALESALDDRIIPSRLRKDIDQHLNSLKQLAEVDPGIQIKKQKTKLRRLGKVVKLNDAKLEAVVKKVSSPSTISDRELASLVEAGELEKEEAKELGLTVSLYGLLDENFELTEAIKKGDFPQMPRGRVTHMEDLISFNKEDWLSMIKKANVVEPPGGLKQEDYAALLARKVEILYPSKTLWARMRSEKTEALTEDLDDLQPLFDRNENVFGLDRFDRLDIAGIAEDEVEKLRKGYSHLKHVSNAYPGLRIGEIFDDHRLSISEKKKEISDSIGLLARFQAQNPKVEFLALDYGPASEDLQVLDFTGFSSDQQSMVLKTLKAYQRMYSITSDATHTRLLLEMGHHSPISITNVSLEHFVKSTGLDKTVGKAYYGNACALTINMYIDQFGVLDAYNRGSKWSHVDNSDPSIDDYLKKFDGWEKFFGSLDYCQCEHCRSILSPAAYFVDLMRFVKMHILDEFFEDREDHVLHLRSRRPDLWKLPLTCDNTNKLIPYLDLINEVLENYIALEVLGVDREDIPAPGAADRSEIETQVYEALLNTASSFIQPFSLPLERLAIYLAHFDLTRGEIATLMEVPEDDTAAATLNLSKRGADVPSIHVMREYELLTRQNLAIGDLKGLYGLHFMETGDRITYRLDGDETTENDVPLLLKPLGLTRAELGQLIETKFVRTENLELSRMESIDIRSEKRIPGGDDASVQYDIERIHGLTRTALDRMHRFTRLWRKVPWSIKELDLVLHHLAQVRLVYGIEEVTLQHLASILSVQKRFDLSVEEVCALWSNLPEIQVVEGKESLFDRLFNLPDFVRLDGKFPKNTFKFLHPAFRDATIPPDPEVNYTLHRLLAGLRVDDETLYQLVTRLSVPLGLDLKSDQLHRKEFPLNVKSLSLLYRHARLAEWLKLSVPDLFKLIRFTEAASMDPFVTYHIAGLSDLSVLLKFYDWWQTMNYSLDDLAYIRGRSVEDPKAYPDAEAITQGILQKVKADQALTFTNTVFAFLEGVTEEQSQAIIEHEENSAIFAEARGIRYRTSETCTADSPIVIPDELGEVTATPDELRDLLLTYHTPSAPVFDDTLFVTIDGVTEEQSRVIVEANPGLIVPVPLENTFWLTETFNPAESLTILEGIPVTEVSARNLLLTYHATEVIPNYLAGELGISVEKTKELIGLTDIDLTESTFTNALQEGDPEGVVLNLIDTLLPLNILFKDDTFDTDALDFISDHLDLFGELNFNDISIENIRMLSIYRVFLAKCDGEQSNRGQLHDVLNAFEAERSRFYHETDPGETESDREIRRGIQNALAQTLATEVGVAITAHEEINLPPTALEALAKLDSCVELSKRFGVGGEVLNFIASNEYEKLNKAANAVLSAFRAKYEDEEKWQENVEPFEDKIRSRKRDALTDYLLHSLYPKIFSSLNDLYHYFLIDVELEGCARTSRVVAANSSVQLYVHRILMNLEQDRAGETQLSMEEDAIEEWEWRKNYRVWEANRKVFLYPENYIEPDLRDNKTPLFKELESTLLQQEINEDTVLEAYASYMRGFDEVANLKIAGSYHDIGDETDFLHLFGVTASEPPVYYYRSVENAYHGERDDTIGIVWHPWRKIDVQIPVSKVSPIVFNARLYVFWVEIVTRPENSRFSGGSSHFVGYKHTLSLKFTTLRLDGTWTPPQKLKLDTHPFDKGEGVIEDLFATGRSEVIEIDGEEFGAVVPCYGTEKDKHSSGMLVDEILEQIPEYENGGIDPGAIVENENSDVKPKDDYTLEGFQWDRIYPRIHYYTTSPKQDLNIRGVRFELDSRVDLFRRKLDTSKGLPISCGSRWLMRTKKNANTQELRYGYSYFTPSYAFATRLAQDDDVLWQTLSEDEFNDGPICHLDPDDLVEVVNGSIDDVIIVKDDRSWILQRSVRDDGRYLLRLLGTGLAESLINQLFERGADGLLDVDYQLDLDERDNEMLANCDAALVELKDGNAGISFTGPFGVYYREIFFHIPFLIANHLNSQQKFAEAQEWYHYIFNPTAKANDTESPKDRVWRYLEFRENDVESLREQLTDTKSIETYKRDPFNPHAIARLPLRFSAYQKSIVMKYIDNLLDWGDHLFAQDTMESINEATLLYVLASDILGERPAELGECGEVDSKTYKEIARVLDEENEFLIEMYHCVQSKKSRPQKQTYDYTIDPAGLFSVTKNANDHVTTRVCKKAGCVISGDVTGISADSDSSALSTGRMEISMEKTNGLKKEGIFRGTDWASVPKQETNFKYIHTFLVAFGNQLGPVFCVPPNEELENYWDRVEDRLFKIRNCMNISGVRRELALFAPEISPMFLIRAKAAGLSIEDVLNSISGNLPPYRFSYIIERAKSYVASLQGFGAALLSALEKKDIEELNLLRTVHQQNILKQTTQVQQWEIDAAVETCQSLQKRKEAVEYRMGYYQDLIDEWLNPAETLQTVSKGVASGLRTVAAGLDTAAAIMYLVPQVGSPFAMKYGGREIGESGTTWSEVFQTSAQIFDEVSASAGLAAGFQRRKEDWQHQADLADHELNELDKQIKAAEIRLDIANKTMEIHEKTIEQQDEIYEFYRDKFSNLGLYTWLSTVLQRLYREAYNSAYAVARLAEQAYRFERGDDAAELIGSNHWEASRAGLLAGERLLIDLQNLERRFLETNYRSMEINQAFSLTQINPAALIPLKETGTCQFEIPEIFFDMFYPGHYRRRIKAVRLTIPCITGPYTNVSATLTLLSSKLRNEPKIDAEPGITYLLDVPRTRTVSIATSTAQNDAGVFELNFRDERYMPFEGAGAISTWKLELPRVFRHFDYNSISDVIFHISYTAKDDGSFKGTVETKLQETLRKYADDHDLIRLFSMKHEFSNELHTFLYPLTEEADQEITMKIDRKNFPYFLHDETISVLGVELIVKLKPGCELSGQTIALARGTDAPSVGIALEPYSEDPDFAEDFADLYKATFEISCDISDGDQWTLKVTAGRLNPEEVEDIGLLFYYTIIAPV